MSNRPRMPFPLDLSRVIRESFSGHMLAERLREAEIWRLWPEAVGGEIARRAQPVRIIDGDLTVVVSSSAWIQELRFMTQQIADKLNTVMGGKIVKQITLKSGRVPLRSEVVQQNIEEAALPVQLTESQLAMIREYSASIADNDTRDAFAELMKASMERSG